MGLHVALNGPQFYLQLLAVGAIVAGLVWFARRA